MVASLIVLALCIAAVVGEGVPAAKFPAAVSPHSCPNYPHCDNVVVAAHTAALQVSVAPYAAPAYSSYGRHGAAVHGRGDKYPAGVDPHLCPNYPYCGPTPVHGVYGYSGAHGWAGVHHGIVGHGFAGSYTAPVYGLGLYAAHHGAGARYPAGVNPHSCPNYPYCHH